MKAIVGRFEGSDISVTQEKVSLQTTGLANQLLITQANKKYFLTKGKGC